MTEYVLICEECDTHVVFSSCLLVPLARYAHDSGNDHSLEVEYR